ncbi:hypothetical protein [Planococcus koreensis]|uniref:hypothetical protein n=1 Tax=Planococcus koreensis TaxID=112331 RepID=UPI0039FBC7D3
MKKNKYIAFDELANHQKKYPGHIPIIGRIVNLEGKKHGEIKGYCDQFAIPIHPPAEEFEMYH